MYKTSIPLPDEDGDGNGNDKERGIQMEHIDEEKDLSNT